MVDEHAQDMFDRLCKRSYGFEQRVGELETENSELKAKLAALEAAQDQLEDSYDKLDDDHENLVGEHASLVRALHDVSVPFRYVNRRWSSEVVMEHLGPVLKEFPLPHQKGFYDWFAEQPPEWFDPSEYRRCTHTYVDTSHPLYDGPYGGSR